MVRTSNHKYSYNLRFYQVAENNTYVVFPETGQIEIDEAEAKLVKDIFKLRSKGLSLAKIGAKYGFSKQKVDYILKNKNYIGVFEYHGKKEKMILLLR